MQGPSFEKLSWDEDFLELSSVKTFFALSFGSKADVLSFTTLLNSVLNLFHKLLQQLSAVSSKLEISL